MRHTLDQLTAGGCHGREKRSAGTPSPYILGTNTRICSTRIDVYGELERAGEELSAISRAKRSHNTARIGKRNGWKLSIRRECSAQSNLQSVGQSILRHSCTHGRRCPSLASSQARESGGIGPSQPEASGTRKEPAARLTENRHLPLYFADRAVPRNKPNIRT